MIARLTFIKRNWGLFALIVFYGYLAFHALSGRQGLIRWVDYKADIGRHEITLEALQAERLAVERDVSQLKAEQLNLDALDMKAREVIFVLQANEMTIYLDQTP